MTRDVADFRRATTRARKLWGDGQYREALDSVDLLLKSWPDNPHLLVMRADLIQLQEDLEGTPTLEEAKASLVRAVSLDEDSPAALIELGYYTYVMEDDPRAALKHFQRAIRICRVSLKAALLGRAKALAELEREPEAVESLKEAVAVPSYNGMMVDKDILRELFELQSSE